MGSVTSLTKAGAAGQRAALRGLDQREAARPPSESSAMPLEGPISLAAALASIMLSLGADGAWTQRSGG